MTKPITACRRCSISHRPACPPIRLPVEPLTRFIEETKPDWRIDVRVRSDWAAGIPDWRADEIAVRLGVHPSRIWDDWFETGLSVLDQLRMEGGWRPAWLHNENDTHLIHLLDQGTAA